MDLLHDSPTSFKANIDDFIDVKPESDIIIYPNPTRGDFNVQLSNIQIGGNVELRMFNILGVRVFDKTYNQGTMSSTDPILNVHGLNGLSPGHYTLMIKVEGKVYSKPIILE